MSTQQRPSDVIMSGSQDVVDAIIRHPFITGLSDGSLPEEIFAHYLVQDRAYIESYARCLHLLAAKAPTPEIGHMLAEHAEGAIAAETTLHHALLSALGRESDPADDHAGPTTVAYTSHLLAACALEPFESGLVSVFPCYWIYGDVARQLTGQNSPHPVYQMWFDNYAGDTYTVAVDEVRAVIDSHCADPDVVPALRDMYETGAQFEWLFWDAAYRLEAWPRDSGFVTL
ncbi:MAG: TenA family protein [Actinomycetes bacterium]